MDAQKVDMFIMTNGKYFPEESLPMIHDRLTSLDDSKWAQLSMLQFKSTLTAIILSVLVGALGIDRFYLGHIGLGIGKLITCGGLGIWTIVDWFLIMDAAKSENYKKLIVTMAF
jgi:Predicted membrane protein